jgi:hypothetical protein
LGREIGMKLYHGGMGIHGIHPVHLDLVVVLGVQGQPDAKRSDQEQARPKHLAIESHSPQIANGIAVCWMPDLAASGCGLVARGK